MEKSKKIVKLVVALLMSVIMMLVALPLSAFSASAANYATDWWNHSEPTKTLSYRSPQLKGDDVKWFQCAINNLIIYGDINSSKLSTGKLDVDGCFGPASKKALIAFQKKYKLTQDGYFGSASRTKMKAVVRSQQHVHSYAFRFNMDTVCIETYCTKCNKTTDRNTTYDEYLSYSKKTDKATTQVLYYRIAYNALLPTAKQTEIDERCRYAAAVMKNANENSNIMLYYERPDGTKSFSWQSGKIGDYCYDSDYLTLEVSYINEFRFLWNKVIPSKIKNIHLLLHSSCYDSLEFYGETLQGEDFASKLNTKRATNKIYLYACNGGTYLNNTSKQSTARTLAKLCKQSKVYAMKDDSVDYSRDTGLPVRHINVPSAPGRWVQEYYSSKGVQFDTIYQGTEWKQ